MKDRLVAKSAAESFLLSEFRGWRIAIEPDESKGVVFRLLDAAGKPRHVLGMRWDLLVSYATPEDLRRFLARLGVRETLGGQGQKAIWLTPTGWE